MDHRIRTIVADDEELARRGIELRLERAPDFEVVARCANGRDALAAIREHRPELLFLDVQMPGLSAFEVVKELPDGEAPLVVFVTAYDQHAIRAFEARAVDYLLKPLDDERFATTLQRVREHSQQRRAAHQLHRLVQLIDEIAGPEGAALRASAGTGGRPSYAQILPVRDGSETLRLPIETIDWVDAAGDYMCIHAAGQTHVLRGTMKEMEDLLDPRVFQRVHRSTIINLKRVRSLRSHTNGEYFLMLYGGHELKLSRSYRDKIEHLLKGVGT